MRVYETLTEAASEIERDMFKSPKVLSTRVQNLTGLNLAGREAFGYTYAILGGIPATVKELVSLGQQLKFPLYVETPERMKAWLRQEIDDRVMAYIYMSASHPPAEGLNPALGKVNEGDHWGYVYRERLFGAIETMAATIGRDKDTRRAYWPIYWPVDAMRSGQPTRVPCSLGYQAMVREVQGEEKLLFFYLQRSCDFHNFWLSDVWFAREMQLEIARHVQLPVGALVHFVISFHSFFAEGTEVY